MADNRIIVLFKRPCDNYMVGEQAAFAPDVAERLAQRQVADVVGPVDLVTSDVSDAVDAALPDPVAEPVKSNKRKG